MTDDYEGDRPPAIRELDNLHVGPAPIQAVVDAGHAAKQRRRTVFASVVAVAVLLVGGGFVTTQVLGSANTDSPPVSNGNNPTATAADTAHTITVNAVDAPGRQCCYFEGAVEQVRIERVSGTEMIPVRSEIEPAPWSRTWSDLPSGEYTLYAAVRPCGGNCDFLDPPTDTCEETLQLDADVVVTVAFDYFTACKIDTSTATDGIGEETQTLPVTVDFLAPDGDEAVSPGTARWDPERMTLAYVPETNYDACLTDGSATASNGSVSLTLTPPIGDIACADVASTALVTISGLTEAPAELAVTEDGETRTIPVIGAPEDTPQDLAVTVEVLGSDEGETAPPGAVFWSPKRGTLAYIARLDYSGSCLPTGSANSDVGSVALVLTASDEEDPCTADANTVLATISGLTEAPTELTVTENGETNVVAVADGEQPSDDSTRSPRLVPDDAAPVDPELQQLAEAFVEYAVGASDDFPHAESVSMAIGGQPVVSIDDIAAALSNRDIWTICPAEWEGYAARTCPINLLGPIESASGNDAPLVYSAQYSDVLCAPERTGPLPRGRLVVLKPPAEEATCVNNFALVLAADDQGRLQSIDLTLSDP